MVIAVLLGCVFIVAPAQAQLNTHLDQAEDALVLTVPLAALTDGTCYTAQTTLDAAAKNSRVVIQNAGHRPLAR